MLGIGTPMYIYIYIYIYIYRFLSRMLCIMYYDNAVWWMALWNTWCSLVRSSLVLENQEARHRCVHVSVQERSPIQQDEPDLIVAIQTQDGHVRRRRPVRDALGPHRCHHVAVLDQHHGSLLETSKNDSEHSTIFSLTFCTNSRWNILKTTQRMTTSQYFQ